MKLCDIGANLTDPVFKGIYRGKSCHLNDFNQVMARARLNHIQKIIVTGTSLEESTKAIELCKQQDGFLYATGNSNIFFNWVLHRRVISNLMGFNSPAIYNLYSNDINTPSTCNIYSNDNNIYLVHLYLHYDEISI